MIPTSMHAYGIGPVSSVDKIVACTPRAYIASAEVTAIDQRHKLSQLSVKITALVDSAHRLEFYITREHNVSEAGPALPCPSEGANFTPVIVIHRRQNP
jgi:hypothetical protein